VRNRLLIDEIVDPWGRPGKQPEASSRLSAGGYSGVFRIVSSPHFDKEYLRRTETLGDALRQT
jgi:hypothetical protein